MLIPVIPTLVGCLQMQRGMSRTNSRGVLFLNGLVAALLTFPSQDYYVVFSLLIVCCTFTFMLLLATASSLELAKLKGVAIKGGQFLAGFLTIQILIFLPKFTGSLVSGVPADWSTPRLAIEQFRYGLLPFTWLIPPPLVAPTLEALRNSGINPVYESYFWSTGSLLIPISWAIAIRRLATPRPRDRIHLPFQDRDLRFIAFLLLLISAIGLLGMTMGGVGTLFAAVVSPVLRSLNRFTVFVYGASVFYLVAELESWMQRHEREV